MILKQIYSQNHYKKIDHILQIYHILRQSMKKRNPSIITLEHR